MHPASRRIFLVLVWTQIISGSGFTVPGADRAWASASESNDLIVRALELRRRGNELAALPLLQQAYRQSHSARAAGQLGFCHQALGQWAEAESYLAIAFDQVSDPWVVKNHAIIETALGTIRSHVGRVEIIGSPPGADVTVNGNAVGKLPLSAPVRVANGEVEVEVHSSGFLAKTRSFHLDGGQYQRIVVRLEPQPSSVSAALIGVTPPSGSEAPPSTSAVTAITESPSDGAPAPSGGHQVRLTLKWVAWGTGLVGVGVGVYGVAANRSRTELFDQGCGLDAQGVPHADRTGTTDAQCSERKSAYESATKVAIGGFVGAAALTAAGFLLWLTEPPTQSSSETTALSSCGPRWGSRFEPGITCALQF